MTIPILVIINGPPGVGKTTLGKRLARDLRLPFLGKDDYKEILFDTLGWRDRAWSRKLGSASFDLLFHLLEREVKVGRSVVAETAFIPRYHTERLLALRRRHGFEPLQIYCQADPETLAARFIARNGSDERHPGHVDPLDGHDDYLTTLQSGKYGVLDIGGRLMELDMTDFASVDYEAVLATISAWTNLPGTFEVPAGKANPE